MVGIGINRVIGDRRAGNRCNIPSAGFAVLIRVIADCGYLRCIKTQDIALETIELYLDDLVAAVIPFTVDNLECYCLGVRGPFIVGVGVSRIVDDSVSGVGSFIP